MLTLLAPIALQLCTATDGDTIRCGDLRIRLSGIDAPEMPGHCRRGRNCAPGDPIASRRSLANALRRGPITFRQLSSDRYGRVVGIVYAANVNLSCWQLGAQQAIYRRDWDRGRYVGAECFGPNGPAHRPR